MTYNTEEIRKLFQSIEDSLNEEDKEIVKRIISDYNGIIKIAVRQQEYIKEHQKQYTDNMNKNHTLTEENKKLRERIERIQISRRCMAEEMRELKQTLRKSNIKI